MFAPSLLAAVTFLLPSVLAYSSHGRPHLAVQPHSVPHLLSLHPVLHARQDEDPDCSVCVPLLETADKCVPGGSAGVEGDGIPEATACLCTQSFVDTASQCYACTQTAGDQRESDLTKFRDACNAAGFPISGDSSDASSAIPSSTVSSSEASDAVESVSASAAVIQGTAVATASATSGVATDKLATTRPVASRSQAAIFPSASASASVAAVTGGAIAGVVAVKGVAMAVGVLAGAMLI